MLTSRRSQPVFYSRFAPSTSVSILLRRIVGVVARCSGRPVGPEGGHTQAMRLQLRIERITRKLREFRRQAQAFPAEIEVVDGSGQECPLRRVPSVTWLAARCRWATPPSSAKSCPDDRPRHIRPHGRPAPAPLLRRGVPQNSGLVRFCSDSTRRRQQNARTLSKRNRQPATRDL